MLKLHNLVSLTKKRKRVGRGGSRGGTSGKGGKGQTQRSGGKIRIGFEGGQMPLFRRLPKRGFHNPTSQEVFIVNVQQLNDFFEAGAHIDAPMLIEKGIIKPKKNSDFKLKVLGTGSVTKKLTVLADAYSVSAKKAIETVGGEARLTKEN